MTDETMTLEQVRDSLRRIGAHPNSLFSKWERAIEAAIAERNVAEWGEPVAVDKTKVGLYRKFDVRRRDGSSAVGGKHHGCEYFVLDTNHDKHALPALAAYADSAECEFPLLSADLRSRYKLDAIAERKVPEWQPIETAPMDRRRVLLGSPTDTFTGKHADGIWIDDAGQFRDPTHWMPLRAAPKVTP